MRLLCGVEVDHALEPDGGHAAGRRCDGLWLRLCFGDSIGLRLALCLDEGIQFGGQFALAFRAERNLGLDFLVFRLSLFLASVNPDFEFFAQGIDCGTIFFSELRVCRLSGFRE